MLRHLYLHVPFCLRRCSYCDFAVQPTRRPPNDEWLAAIARELELTRAQEGWPDHLQLSTIYLGCGPPSLLNVGALASLRSTLEGNGSIDADVENRRGRVRIRKDELKMGGARSEGSLAHLRFALYQAVAKYGRVAGALRGRLALTELFEYLRFLGSRTFVQCHFYRIRHVSVVPAKK